LARAGVLAIHLRHRALDALPGDPPRRSERHIVEGALVGFLLSAILTAVSFFGWKVAGLPFAPFDVFDWVVRLLPGAVVTAAIDTSVAVSRFFGVSSISAAAKAGDQALAILGLLATGAVAGAALFGVLSLSDEPAQLFGVILGATVGGLALVAERQLQRLPPGSVVAGLWVLATFVVWGFAFGRVHDRLKLSTTEDTEDAEDRRHRRRFLRSLVRVTVLLSTASTVAGIIAGRRGRRVEGRRWSDDHQLSNADDAVTPLDGTRAEFTPIEQFYRIDTDTRAPSIDAARWRLNIAGLIERPQSLALDELRALEPTDLFATLCCISNPPGGDLISTTRWTGVSLRRLLPRMALQASATHLKIISADGFFESVALDTVREDERVMLAYAWDGVPLPVEHGYPLRLYVPNLYGMKQPKWIVAIEATSAWEPGYWVARGWSRDGLVSPFSAIDVVRARDGMLDIGGVAFAGARGVSKVEVRVDDGVWHEAKRRRPLSDVSWVVWRATVPASAGEHLIAVRAVDGRGELQSAPLHSRRT
jgi:DMSO/TMAO reductase YedYZ molybdopterin-dependent catalytic subunit